MAEVASAWVTLAPSAKGFRAKLDKEIGGDVESSGKKAGASFGKMFAAAGGLLAAAGVGSALKNAIGGAGDLQQSIGAIDTVFDGSAKRMHKWSKGAALNVGLTRNEFNELGTLIGAQLKNGGTAMDQLAPKTKNLITLGADLSSMFGGSTKEAVEALSSALKGERDPIERYGVSLNQAKIDSEAAALGFKKVDGALSGQAQQAATLSLIMKQTADAQGNFAKESNTLSGQTQRLSAQWGNLTTNLGTLLVPALTTVAGKFSGFLTEMQKGTGLGGHFVDVVTSIKNNLGTIAPALGVVAGGLLTFKVASLAAAAASAIQAAGTSAATGATWSLNTALRANPIGIVVTALTALGVGLVIAYKKSETFRKVVNAMWAGIKVAGTWVASMAKQLSGLLSSAFSSASSKAQSFMGALASLGRAIVDRVQDVTRFAAGVKEKFGQAVDFVRTIPAKVTAALGNLAMTLYNSGKELIQGLINGIKAKIADVAATMRDVADKVKGFLPGSPVKEGPLTSWNNGGAGLRLMDLLAKGIKKGGPKAVKALKDQLKGLKSEFASLRDSIASALTPTDLFSGTLGDLRNGLSGWGNHIASIAASVKSLLSQGVGGKFLEQLVSSGNAGLLAEVAASGSGAALAAEFNANLGAVQGIGGQVADVQFGDRIERVEKAIDRMSDRIVEELARSSTRTGSAVGHALNVGASKSLRERRMGRGSR